jgi:hypothetical protein
MRRTMDRQGAAPTPQHGTKGRKIMIKNSFYLVAVPAIALSSVAAQADITSTFDQDVEGWSFFNDARNFIWTDAVGSPPGAIRATDVGDGRIWYFAASSAYLGNMSSFYGGNLSWDIIGLQGSQTSIAGRADVMIAGGGLTLGLAMNVLPVLNQWTSWQATLSTDFDWRVISDIGDGIVSPTVATEAQIRDVLSDLTGLYIRGEYTNGSDSAGLDNVILTPSPASWAALGLAGLMGTRRRRD